MKNLVRPTSGVTMRGTYSAKDVLLTILVIAGIWAAYVLLLPEGGISRIGEFHTLDRASSFARQSDWFTVYSLGDVTFNKPPLQYWMSALLMEAGLEQTIALRLPSMLFALGNLVATALLAAAIMPGVRWVMIASVLLCSSSVAFWTASVSAMLDTGNAFFSTLALASAVLALRQSTWWYVAAVAIALGALQKSPAAFALVAVFLIALFATSRFHGYRFSTLRADRPFRRSVLIAIVGVFAWTVLQTALHGFAAIDDFFGDQMIDRFKPDPLDGTWNLSQIGDLLIDDEEYLRIPGILALYWLPWRVRRLELIALPAVFTVFALAMVMADGSVYSRYALNILSLLSVALASVLLSFRRYIWAALAAVAVVALATGSPLKRAEDLRLYPPDIIGIQNRLLSEVGAMLTHKEELVYCSWDRTHTRFRPGGVSYFASDGRRVFRLGKPRSIETYLKDGNLNGPIRGVCRSADLALIADRLVGLEIVKEESGYAIWTAERARSQRK